MHYKQNNKETKSYVQGLRSFGNTLPHGIKGILRKSGYNYSEIISKWNLIVGKKISNLCHPKSIKTTKDNSDGILVLAIERGNEIEVEYSKNEIINKVNSYFGYKLINQIKLKSLNPENKKNKIKKKSDKLLKKFETKLNEIKSSKIKDSLSELLSEIKND